MPAMPHIKDGDFVVEYSESKYVVFFSSRNNANLRLPIDQLLLSRPVEGLRLQQVISLTGSNAAEPILLN